MFLWFAHGSHAAGSDMEVWGLRSEVWGTPGAWCSLVNTMVAVLFFILPSYPAGGDSYTRTKNVVSFTKIWVYYVFYIITN